MTLMIRTITAPTALCVLLLFAGAASAQTSAPAVPADSVTPPNARAPWALEVDRLTPPGAARLAADRFSQSAPVPRRRGISPAATGALIGAAAAVGVTYAAASRYGNNEGGRFCTRCFVQWSAVSAPVGAVAGAAIGWGVGRARRSVTATPVISRRARGVVIAASF